MALWSIEGDDRPPQPYSDEFGRVHANGWPRNPVWSVRRTGGVDLYGEWKSGDSWVCEREVSDCLDPDLRMKIVVCVQGRRDLKTNKLRARSWSAVLRFGSFERPLLGDRLWARRSCNSIASALRQADGIDLTTPIYEIVRLAYSNPRHMSCIYKKGEDGQYEPFATMLGVCPKDSRNWGPLGYGEFAVLRWHKGPNDTQPRVRVRQVVTDSGWWAGRPIDEGVSLGHWLLPYK